jgi:nucleoside-diphosphate-sugar epimerase
VGRRRSVRQTIKTERIDGVRFLSLHLVTGGSGFVGSNIARLLHARGESVRVLDIWKDDNQPADIDFILADINDREAVERAMRGVDYVHHNVALVPLAKAGKSFAKVNVEGTRTALAAARAASVKMFCHMSSSAVFGSPDKMPITNETPLLPIEIYGRAKLSAEMLVEQAGRDGLPVTVIRPRTIVGSGRLGIFEILFDWIRDEANIYIIGPGTYPFQFVHVDDLADVSIMSALQRTPGVFNVGTDKFGTLRDDLGSLIKHAGSKSGIKSLPVPLAIGTLAALDKLGLSPLGPWHYLTYHKPFYFDIGRAIDKLGWHPKYDNVSILTEAYDWFVKLDRQTEVDHGRSFHKRRVRQGILRILKALS